MRAATSRAAPSDRGVLPGVAARSFRLHYVVLLAAAGAGVGCDAPGRVEHGAVVALAPAEGHLLTPLDYLAAGEERVSAWLADDDPGLAAARRAGEALAVRIHASVADGVTRRGALGSGVLVDGGRRVLTAAHNLPASGAELAIRVTLADGRTLAARLVAAGEGSEGGDDWALLELEHPPALATPELAAPRRGERCVVLGYPGRSSGRTPDGRFVEGPAHAERELAPVALVVEVCSVAPLRLAPLAGALPGSGASGGPVLDARGALVGVLLGTTMVHDSESVEHALDAAPSSAFADALVAQEGMR